MSRTVIAPLLVLLSTGSLAATAGQKSALPPALTKADIRAGWIEVLAPDGYGWRVSGSVGKKGKAILLGGKETTRALCSTPFESFEIKAYFRAKGGEAEILLVPTTRPKAEPECLTLIEPSAEWQVFQQKVALDVEGPWQVGLNVPKGTQLEVAAIYLRPLNTESLFNGKNLDGWVVLPGYKSKYTVTKEGWLNVRNGRGDIQTKRLFKNFVLQLECISHGKHLNSGIFFRCIPGQYQQGYEAQIRNEATPDKPRTYVLPKYDPRTHKQVGTVKIVSEAVDYGTGGIYRRMPARRVVSKDGEWFTMTIAAHGRHIATWVNGVQVTDWTDHRPLNRNARRGCCLESGAISIQGHDPTTNLSFRNIRIAILPPK